MLSLETLGALRLVGPDGDVLAGRRKELALVAYLARRSPREVTRTELATLLWGERDEARARHSLRQALLQLKRVLGDGFAVDAERVSLRAGAVALDAARFEAAVADGRFADAIALWHGDFLAPAEDAGGENYRLWVEGERVSLRARLAGAFESLVSRAESRGEWAEALASAERWLEALPLDERAALRVLQLLRLEGREADARSRYAELETRLREELGREPAAELQRFGARLGRTVAGADGASSSARAADGRAALLTAELAGRGSAFAELAGAWQRVRDGVTAVVLVEGEPGIGKTRLCHEFVQWVARRDDATAAEPAVVLWERAEAAGDTESWATARRLLAPLAAAPGLAGAAPEQLAELAALVPTVAAFYTGLPPATGAEAAITAAVTQVLGAIAAEAPVLVGLDDFTRADPATQRLLLAVARAPRAAAVLLLLADPGDGADPVGALAELRAMRPARRLRLQPLRHAEVERMVGSMLALGAGAERAALAERVAVDAGGNPGRVVELVTALVDRGALRSEGGGWRLEAAAAPPALPPRVDRDVPPPRPSPPPSERASSPPASPSRGFDRGRVLAAALLLAAALGGALYAARARLAGERGTPTAATSNAVAGARSIAVIPLTHASADSATEYFTEGMTEELVHALSSVDGLRVAARTSVLALKGRQLDAREIGKALGVDAVIEGSVRTAGDSARITVQLVSTADGYDVWSERYDRGIRNALGVQEEIARSIVARLRPSVPRAAAGAEGGGGAGTRNAAALDLFLRARHLDNRPGVPNLRKAIAYYGQAIALDSTFARAYAGLANGYVTLLGWNEPYSETVPIARAMAERALRLDSTSGDAHRALARLHSLDWQWEEADREFRRAVAANPNDVVVHHSYSHLLITMGRLDESLAESRAALALDPLDPRIVMHLCIHYYYARQFDEALATCQQGLELDPSFPDSHEKIAWVYAARGDDARALAELDEELRVSGPVPEYRAARAFFLARAGRRAEALAALGDVERTTPRAKLPLATMAAARAALGDRDRAFALLAESYAAHQPDMAAALRTDPIFDPLRADPRFGRLLAQLGLGGGGAVARR